MLENDRGHRRGRLPADGELKNWGSYLDAVRTVMPLKFRDWADLYGWMFAESPSAVHATVDTFRRVLRGTTVARPGFAAALVHALRLDRLGIGPADFELPLDQFQKNLVSEPSSPLMKLLKLGADGTAVRLKAAVASNSERHFGRPTARRDLTLVAERPYRLEIDRPSNLAGVSGYVCLLGYGFLDQEWQLVSAVADRPLSPAQLVQWASNTGISISPTSGDGRFRLYVVGSTGTFPTRLTGIYNRCIEGGKGAFLTPKDICRATIRVRAGDNQGERVLRAFRRREGGARPEAERPQKSA